MHIKDSLVVIVVLKMNFIARVPSALEHAFHNYPPLRCFLDANLYFWLHSMLFRPTQFLQLCRMENGRLHQVWIAKWNSPIARRALSCGETVLREKVRTVCLWRRGTMGKLGSSLCRSRMHGMECGVFLPRFLVSVCRDRLFPC